MKKPLIYIIEDERKMRDILRINLESLYDLKLFCEAESACGNLENDRPSVIATDVRLPGMNGIDFMQKVHSKYPEIPFIIFTGYGSIDNAVETMKKGAFDYLVKPIKIQNLIQSINRALSYVDVLHSKPEISKEELLPLKIEIDGSEMRFITRDAATLQTLNVARKAAGFKTPILIVGETGTGKELISRFIHAQSGRKGQFVKMNCASIPKDILEAELFGFKKGSFTSANRDYEGKLALSDRGTLFLDEIGEMPPDLQAKLLHILEIPEYYPIGSNAKKRIDLNIIAATNRNLRTMVDEGLFRRDLYYRIAVIPIRIPPLRERKCDIIPIAEYFLKEIDPSLILSPKAKLKLMEYNWPGNVRELKNVIERSVLLSDKNKIIEDIIFDDEGYNLETVGFSSTLDISYEELPETWDEFKTYKSKKVKEEKQSLEKIFVEKLLIKTGGNISAAAKEAGIDRRQLQDMIKELGIDVSIFKGK